MSTLEESFELDGRIGSGFDEYLFYLFVQTVNRRNRDFAPKLSDVSLSLADWRALSVMNRLDSCLMSELADFTTVDRTTLTRTVDGLVKRGLAARSASAQDRRQVRVEMTEKGRSCFTEALGALRTHNRQALDGLSEANLQQLRALLQRILRNIVQDKEQFERLIRFER